MSVTVRRATRADAAGIAELALRLFELHTTWDPRRFSGIATSEGAMRFYGDRSEADQAAVFVAHNDKRMVGFAYMEYEPVLYAELATNVAWLHDIYVDLDARGKGTGRALLAAVSEAAKGLGANKVLLSVANGNVAGQRFFQQSGYRTTMLEMMLELE
jgi:GNAT superfamily N-acetyltransferase